jgi:cytochrome oxidase Cu insertion factor (SCO1/SenC/PrrC family)
MAMTNIDSRSGAQNEVPGSRGKLYALVALFFAPLLLAFLLYYGAAGWRPAGSTNHGDLITPARPLPEAALQTPEGAELKLSALHGKWTLVYIGTGQCDARCREALTLMRQTRLALNDNMKRVQRLFVATGDCCDQTYLDAEQAGLIVARTSDSNFMTTFARDAKPVAQAGRIYIVDPLGNLMMSYDPGAKPKGLFEDLKKLLKLSHIG